jgi:hypothetical protein
MRIFSSHGAHERFADGHPALFHGYFQIVESSHFEFLPLFILR